MRTAEQILADLVRFRATEGRENVIALYKEAEELLDGEGRERPVCDICKLPMTLDLSWGMCWECPEHR